MGRRIYGIRDPEVGHTPHWDDSFGRSSAEQGNWLMAVVKT